MINRVKSDNQQTEEPFPPLLGAEHVGISDPESPNFIAHPWSATHTTSLFASAFMRAEHVHTVTRSLTGEVAYLDAEEIRLKASLIEKARKTL